MTRFLTPAKIGLLSLIELYTQEIVPTASTIPILSFILNQVLPSTSHAALVPGRTLWDQFLKKIWSIDSLDALHEFFANRRNLLAKTYEENKNDQEMGIPPPSEDMIFLSRTSPFGSFIRRSKVEFDRLKFGDAVALWIAFAKWRQDTQAYYMRRNGQIGRWAGDKALEKGEELWGIDATENLESVAYGLDIVDDAGEGNVSTDDVEKLLEFQVEQMQSQHEEGMKRLESLDENSLRSWKANQYWLEYRGILRLKADLHKNNLDAWRARLIPALWMAMGAIANILTSLSEFHAASSILIAIIPRALECENCAMSAQLYSFLVDAYMGLAGQAEPGSVQRKQNLTHALEYIDRAFSEHSDVGDVKGQCEMVAKKATVMMALGDKVLANDYASQYLDLKREMKIGMV
ncbi:putative Anaphase-promoting complex subunit 5 [Glarea lozoyensis 74030]|uniref:Putative Anaphase-promoting complex subunit 5 n=1 Tax=Glarea lozoyensis (strain ATCC 74030 / MF5533) TaxID=1104152 RepID=H0EZM9_GLAL7|nr:putative Anaphase-promoting complex subunit 5 [Glarea lozoyensis 74030]